MTSVESELRTFSERNFREVVERVTCLTGFIGDVTDDDILDNALKWRRFFQPSSFYGHVLGQNVSIVGRYRCFADVYATDSWGISKNSVGVEDADEKIYKSQKSGQPVIAFFGGSTMQGVGCRVPNFSIPSLVERILYSRYRVRAACVNHGVAGWCSAEQLLFLMHGLRYSPNVCVFYDGWNCCWNFYNGLFLSTSEIQNGAAAWRRGTSLRHYEHDIANLDRFRARAAIWQATRLLGSRVCGEISKSVPSARWSRFWSRVSSAAFPLRGPDPTRGVWTKTIPVELRDELLRDSVSEYLRIDALASCLCRGQGLKFLHFLQPLIQTAGRRLTVKEEGLLKSSRKIADPEVFALFCRAVAMRSTEIIDLTRLFDDIDDDVFVDDGHLNRFGNYHVATRIARELTTRGIVNSQNVR